MKCIPCGVVFSSKSQLRSHYSKLHDNEEKILAEKVKFNKDSDGSLLSKNYSANNNENEANTIESNFDVKYRCVSCLCYFDEEQFRLH
jgi:uncharacterized membrane protein YgaE (UPF0421/DUF939 family)